MLFNMIEAFAALLTLCSLILLSEAVQLGFTVGIVANLLWVAWGFKKEANGLILLNITLIGVNLNGVLN